MDGIVHTDEKAVEDESSSSLGGDYGGPRFTLPVSSDPQSSKTDLSVLL